MQQEQRIWRERAIADEVIDELCNALRLSPLTARILAGRGIEDGDHAERFLAKRLADVHRPQALGQMERAATRFAQALNERQTILIHGDYDVDGSTSTTLLTLFCRAMGHTAIPWIPHRRIDGYGLSAASLAAVQEHQADLMITVDCGIADHGWAARIEAESGCQVIITDHHLPQGDLPQCHAVVNPNHPDCPYPEKGLAGVGVAWKLAWATACTLTGCERLPESLRDFLMDALALVAVGTVADCAPLDGENRILVHHGLKALAKTRNPGLRALLDHAKVGDHIRCDDIGWRIAPLLNASGRLGSAMRNVHLLTCETATEAQRWLAEIVSENEERRRLSQMLSNDLIAEVEERAEYYLSRASLVFAGEGWHAGVVGIVASRLTERFAKPSAVIAIDEGQGKGSLRTIPSIHLARALESCAEHLIRGGGHAMAAGISIAADQVDAFSEAFDQAVRQQSPDGLQAPGVDHDGRVSVRQLDQTFFHDLDRLAPFGQNNPEPLLRVDDASFVTRPSFFGRSNDHLRGAVTDQGGGMLNLLAWKARSHFPHLLSLRHFTCLVRPQVDWFRGERQHRVVLVDGSAP
ncbi:MAG: single-stranded-DNA-specific exonuclease RecJ [Planctomycetota bacterium]|nr:MAG: single-stranded-DNA-specific exonuclease RecJ [Planctomycetota bacterium]